MTIGFLSASNAALENLKLKAKWAEIHQEVNGRF